jgi:hypothetical protein
LALSRGTGRWLEFRREVSERVRNDLPSGIFDKSVRYLVKKRVLACQSVKPQEISSDYVSCGCIA